MNSRSEIAFSFRPSMHLLGQLKLTKRKHGRRSVLLRNLPGLVVRCSACRSHAFFPLVALTPHVLHLTSYCLEVPPFTICLTSLFIINSSLSIPHTYLLSTPSYHSHRSNVVFRISCPDDDLLHALFMTSFLLSPSRILLHHILNLCLPHFFPFSIELYPRIHRSDYYIHHVHIPYFSFDIFPSLSS